jgi:hypothetical protein
MTLTSTTRTALFILAAALCRCLAAQSPRPTPEPRLSTTPALIATGYNTSEAFVVGKDFRTRHCPSDFNLYVRVDKTDSKQPPDKNLYYVQPKSVMTPQQGVSYAVFCIREDVH